jgi:hypothetical protein
MAFAYSRRMSAIIAMLLLASAIDPDLLAAEHAFEKGEYDAVLPRLDQAMDHHLPLAQLEQALALRAQTEAAFGHSDPAVDAFRRLLGMAPSWLPAPDASPKLLALFSEARRRGAIDPPPGLVPKPKVELVPVAPPVEPKPPVVEPPTPLTSRWWFWTAVGVVVVGAAAAGTYAYVQRPVTPAGSLGTGNLQ